MKKLRLKRWVKVVITLIIICISFFIWKLTGTLGELAQTSLLYSILCVISWIYLLIGQLIVYGFIWK